MKDNMGRNIFLVAIVVLVGVLIYLDSNKDTTTDVAEVEPAKTDVETAAAAKPKVGMIDDERIINAESEPGNWLAYGRTYEEQRFSPLDQHPRRATRTERARRSR